MKKQSLIRIIVSTIGAIGTISLTAQPSFAQSSARNLMPDGSHDMYLGLGLISRPHYEGAEKNKRSPLLLAQIQWSNGLFISGMSAGWHLSENPKFEYGPLFQIEPSRTPNGLSNSIGTPESIQSDITGPNFFASTKNTNKLVGLTDIHTRLIAGGFHHLQIGTHTKLINVLSYGYGNDSRGLRLTTDIRYSLDDLFPHHKLSLAAGVNTVNTAYNRSYFGVSDTEAGRSLNPSYRPGGGIKDLHADLTWNWNWSADWMLTSKIKLSHLVGGAGDSPLVERRSNFYASTAIAYRF